MQSFARDKFSIKSIDYYISVTENLIDYDSLEFNQVIEENNKKYNQNESENNDEEICETMKSHQNNENEEKSNGMNAKDFTDIPGG